MTNHTDAAWVELLAAILANGQDVAAQATAGAAGRRSRELMCTRTITNMDQPLLTVARRRLGYRFAVREAAWVLSGDNRVATAPKELARYSDDGLHLNGAYGPPLRDQLPYLLRTLADDPTSRQAVATIWRPRPGPSKDTPCTVALQLLVRPAPDRGRLLHVVDTMRSSDVWTGWPYDVFTFSMVGAYAALCLRRLGVTNLRLGRLYLTSGSSHLYEDALADAREIVLASHAPREVRLQTALAYAALDLDEFQEPDDLLGCLHSIGRGEGPGHRWLQELHAQQLIKRSEP